MIVRDNERIMLVRKYALHKVLAGLFCGWIAGVAGGLFLASPAFGWVAMAAGMSVLSVWYRERLGWRVVCFCVALGGGLWYAQSVVEEWSPTHFPAFTVKGEAGVVRETEASERSLRAVLRFDRCETKCPNILVAASFPLHAKIAYGEKLSIECELKVPEAGEDGVDYRMLAAKDGIGYRCFPKHWEKLEEEKGGLLVWLGVGRKALENGLSVSVTPPESSLLSGLLFGGDDRLSDSLRDRFSATGMTHIVAVSGSNIALVMEWLIAVSLAIGLWRHQALWLSLIGVILFVLMVGAEASAVRAGIMGTLTILALRSGRVSSGIQALLCAAAVMLAYNPLLLRYDLGFQLSFLATLGILVLLSLRQDNASEHSAWKDILWMTIAAELFVLPIIAFTFHTVPVVSLVSNMLILPVLPLAMLAALATAVLGVIAPSLAWLSGWVAYMLAHYVIGVVEFLGGQSWSTIALPSFGFVWVISWYALVALGFMMKRHHSSEI